MKLKYIPTYLWSLIIMTPRAYKYGLRYYWDKDFRRKKKLYEKGKKRIKKVGSGFHSRKNYIKTKLFKRDGNKCSWCNEKMTLKSSTIDHIIPVSRGGNNDRKNLRLMHKECNETRSRVDL